MSSPLLRLRRLIVEGELSCDIPFVNGLNVVYAFSKDLRATNNAGKSTLVELIQHGLGKKQESKAKWYLNPIMDQVDTLYLELQLNDDIFTIERSLRNITAAATIRHTSYIPDIKNIPGQKIAIDEMSDWFLTALNIPIVAVSMTNGKLDPLSFPLLMRTFVLNQRLSFGAILNKVQPEQRIADTIGFLTGIIPLERFTLESALSTKLKEVQNLETYFVSVNRFLIESIKSDFSFEDLNKDLLQAEEAFEAAKEAQISFQMKLHSMVQNQTSSSEGGRVKYLQKRLIDLKEEISQLRSDFDGIIQEQNRLGTLLNSLKMDRLKVQRLKTSSYILNSVDFSTCPRCLQQITLEMKEKEEYGRCCLCSRPLATTSDSIPKIVPRTEDIDLQIEEVESVLSDISKEKENIQERLADYRSEELEIGNTLDAETRTFVAPAVDQLLEYTYEVSRREAQLIEKRNLYKQVRAMNNIRDSLNKNKLERARLSDELREVSKINKERLEEFRQILENILREIDFPDLESCVVDRQKLIPIINGTLYTNLGAAYASLVVVCYHLALLELALKEEVFFPRFLVIDSPNVHDINETSENKLLRYLVKLANDNKSSSWQIILTSRKMVDGLDAFIQARISKTENQMLLRKRQ